MLKTRGQSRILKLRLERGNGDRSTSIRQLRILYQGLIRENYRDIRAIKNSFIEIVQKKTCK